MSPLKDFTLIYEVPNEEDTFSGGDSIIGMVSFTLTKDTKVKSLSVKVKGDAHVHWTEGIGDNKKSYTAHRRYFKDKEYLVPENTKATVLPPGPHCFKFRLKIPKRDMPSSFKGSHGKIVYMLEATMSRSWHLPCGPQKELKFVSKSLSRPGQARCPRSGSVDKEVGVFSKGQVKMSATIDRKVCSPGDTLSVVCNISNSSSKKMTSKFSLHQRVVYRACGSTKTDNQILRKIVGDTITMNSVKTVSCRLKIPADVTPTIHNCEIISIDYYIKVYLDISFAFDPEVVFPLVIVPSRFTALSPGKAVGPRGAAAAPSYSDFPAGPHPVPAGPGACGYPAPAPTQHANTTSGFSYQWPQQVAPNGFPAAAFPPSSVQHQGPAAPPLFQQEDPPSYSSLFPPSHDTFGSTGSDQKS